MSYKQKPEHSNSHVSSSKNEMKKTEIEKDFSDPTNTRSHAVSCEFQLAADEATGVGGKRGMRKEGPELEGMKEERGVQANEEGR